MVKTFLHLHSPLATGQWPCVEYNLGHTLSNFRRTGQTEEEKGVKALDLAGTQVKRQEAISSGALNQQPNGRKGPEEALTLNNNLNIEVRFAKNICRGARVHGRIASIDWFNFQVHLKSLWIGHRNVLVGHFVARVRQWIKVHSIFRPGDRNGLFTSWITLDGNSLSLLYCNCSEGWPERGWNWRKRETTARSGNKRSARDATMESKERGRKRKRAQ